MNDLFNFLGSLIGYLLWFFYVQVKNYGGAIILFTVFFKLLTFPFSIKTQRSMAASSRLTMKMKDLQKKYAKDKQKLQIETQKLYEREGVNPAGGCSTMFIPLLVMFCLYNTVLFPMANALHLSSAGIDKAVSLLGHVPGISSTFNQTYAQIEVVKHFAELRPYLTMFSAQEMARLESFSHGFRFLGLNLLDTPCDPGNIFGTMFRSNLWVIPIGNLVLAYLTQYFTMKMQPGMQQQQGCMKATLFIFPLFSVWLAATMPAAVGFYYILSLLLGFLQTVALNIWFAPDDLNAQAEARRVALREQEEAALKPLPAVKLAAAGARPATGTRPAAGTAQTKGKKRKH
jgi:YidC/Oxa1 family membrane protein insertase